MVPWGVVAISASDGRWTGANESLSRSLLVMGDRRDAVCAREGLSQAPLMVGDGREADDAVESCRRLRWCWEMRGRVVMSMGGCRDLTGDGRWTGSP